VAHLGVDEKAIAKRHRYLTIVADLARGRVLYLTDDRKQESLDRFCAMLTPAQMAGIEAVAMDMWEPYMQSTRAHLPDAGAKVVFDKFHVVKHLHDAVDHAGRPATSGSRAPSTSGHAAPGHEPRATPGLPRLAPAGFQGGPGVDRQ
jgi:transposase